MKSRYYVKEATLDASSSGRRFKHLKLSERYDRVKVDQAHKIRTEVARRDDVERCGSHLGAELERLVDLELSSLYVRTSKPLSLVSSSLEAIFHVLPKIVSHLLENLRSITDAIRDSGEMESSPGVAVFCLLRALIRDVGSKILPFLESICGVMKMAASANDIELLEAAIQTTSDAITACERTFDDGDKGDEEREFHEVVDVVDLYWDCLTHPEGHVRKFAAVSLRSFLVRSTTNRKTRVLSSITNQMDRLGEEKAPKHVISGIGTWIGVACCGVNKQAHTGARDLLEVSLPYAVGNAMWQQIHLSAIESILDEIHFEHLGEIIKVFVRFLATHKSVFFLKCMGRFFDIRKRLCPAVDPAIWRDQIIPLVMNDVLSRHCFADARADVQLFKAALSLWQKIILAPVKIPHENYSTVMDELITKRRAISDETDHIYAIRSFLLRMLSTEKAQFVRHYVVEWCSIFFAEVGFSTTVLTIIEPLVEMCLRNQAPKVTDEIVSSVSTYLRGTSFATGSWYQCPRIWAALVIVHGCTADFLKDHELVRFLSSQIREILNHELLNGKERVPVFSQLFRCAASLMMRSSLADLIDVCMSWLRLRSNDPYVLSVVGDVFVENSEFLKSKGVVIVESVLPLVVENFLSRNPVVRLQTAKILDSLPDMLFKNAENEDDVCRLFSEIIVAESENEILSDLHARPNAIVRIHSMFSTGRMPDILLEASIHYLIGAFFVKLQPIWQPAVEGMQDAARVVPGAFWETFWGHFCNCHGHLCEEILASAPSDGDNMDIVDEEKSIPAFDNLVQSMHGESVDLLTHFQQMFKVLQGVPSISSAHQDELVEKFVLFFETVFVEMDKRNALSKVLLPGFRNARSFAKEYVSFLSKLNSLKTLRKAAILREILMKFLSSPDELLQKGSFECLWKLHPKVFSPVFRESIIRLIDSKTSRDEMTQFHENGKSDASIGVEAVVSVVWGKLHTNLPNSAARRVLLRLLGNYDPAFVQPFFDKMLAFDRQSQRACQAFSHLTEEVVIAVPSVIQLDNCIALLRESLDLALNCDTKQTRKLALKNVGPLLEHVSMISGLERTFKEREDFREIMRSFMTDIVVPYSTKEFTFDSAKQSVKVPTVIGIIDSLFRREISFCQQCFIDVSHDIVALLCSALSTRGSERGPLLFITMLFDYILESGQDDAKSVYIHNEMDCILGAYASKLRHMKLHVSKLSGRALQKVLTTVAKFSSFFDKDVKKSQHSSSLAGILLPYMTYKRSENILGVELLSKMLGLVRVLLLACEESTSFLSSLCWMLVNYRDVTLIPLVVDVILSLDFKGKQDISAFLKLANTPSRTQIGAYDIDSVLEGLKMVRNAAMFHIPSIDSASFALIASQLERFLSSQEYVLRVEASSLFAYIIKQIPMCETEEQTMSMKNISENIISMLYRNIKSSKEDQTAKRAECLKIYRQIVLYDEEFSAFRDLLVSKDSEKDFFLNIGHVKAQKNALGFEILESVVESMMSVNAGLCQRILRKLVFPMVNHVLFETKNDNLIKSCENCVRKIGSILDWSVYHRILMTWVSQIARHKEREVFLTRAICAFLESFRFPLTEDSPPVPVHWGSSVFLEHTTVSNKVSNMIIPALKKLVHWESKTPRIALAFAIARLCKTGPPNMARAHLPGLLSEICRRLRDKRNDEREKVRKVFISMVIMLGPLFCGYALDTLGRFLGSGPLKHVQSHIIHSILVEFKRQKDLSVGTLDYCLPQFYRVLVEDSFSLQMAEERTVEKITAIWPEARISKSPESYEILAEIATLTEENVQIMLNGLEETVRKTLVPWIVKVAESLLHRISVGMRRNPSLCRETVVNLFDRVYSTYLSMLEEERKKREEERPESLSVFSSKPMPRVRPEETFTVLPEPGRQGAVPNSSRVSTSHNYDVLLKFAVDLVKQVTPSVDGTFFSPDDVNMMTEKLEKTLKHPSTRSAKAGIDGITALMKYQPNLDCWKQIVPSVITDLIRIAQDSSKGVSTSSLGEACVTAINGMLRSMPDAIPEKNDRESLFSLLLVDLENSNTTKPVVFALIRTMIGAKENFVHILMFDLMEKCSHIMIQNRKSGTQDQAARTFQFFLTVFPMEEQKIVQYINFLLANIDYEEVEGRVVAVNVLGNILMKLPPTLMGKVSERVFLSLAHRISTENDPGAHRVISSSMNTLLGSAEVSVRNYLFEKYLLKWILASGDQSSLRRVAVVTLNAVEKEDILKPYLEKFLKPMEEIVLTAHNEIKDWLEKQKSDDDNEFHFDGDNVEDEEKVKGVARVPKRKDEVYHGEPTILLYSCAKFFEKVLRWNADSLLRMESVWSAFVRETQHPHPWMKTSLVRLFGFFFAEHDRKELSILTEDMFGILLKSFAFQLRNLSQFDGDEYSTYRDQLIKNLLFVIDKKMQCRQRGAERGEDLGADIITITIRRLSRTSRHSSTPPFNQIEMLKFFGACVAKFGMRLGEEAVSFILHAVHVLGHAMPRNVLGEMTGIEDRKDVQEFAIGLEDLLRSTLDPELFVTLYHSVQEGIQKKRLERRQKRKVLSVSDPHHYAAIQAGKHRRGKESRHRREKEETHMHKRRKRS